MNSYIIRPLAQIKKKLSSKETLSPDTIDSIIGELKMIKLNIEQHITNMPENREQNNILSAAHNAVQNLTEILDSFAGMECPPEDRGHLQAPVSPREKCFFAVHLRGASDLANTKSASKMTCRHMMTSQFRSERGKTRKREISRDFSRFFDPAFFRSFIDPFCPFRCCVRIRTGEMHFLI